MINICIRNLIGSLLLGSVIAFPTGVLASTVTMKNDTDSEIVAYVEPGEGKIIANSANQLKYTLKPNEKKVIEVKKDNLGDIEVFSIKGSVTAPSLYNRCTGLFLNKDYNIVFVPGKVGVVCHATDELYKSECTPATCVNPNWFVD